MRDALPDAAAPVAVTLIGGLGLVVALAMILGSEQPDQAEAPPSAATVATDDAVVSAEEPAMTTTEDARIESEPSLLPQDEEEQATFQPPAATVEEAPDPAQTASILSAIPTERALRPGVEVAETEEEIAALEAIQRREVEQDVGVPEPATMTTSSPAMREAATNNYVNMRAGPSDDAEVLTVVPANARIDAEDDCDWCSVAYDGRSGYIYRTFISYQ